MLAGKVWPVACCAFGAPAETSSPIAIDASVAVCCDHPVEHTKHNASGIRMDPQGMAHVESVGAHFRLDCLLFSRGLGSNTVEKIGREGVSPVLNLDEYFQILIQAPEAANATSALLHLSDVDAERAKLNRFQRDWVGSSRRL